MILNCCVKFVQFCPIVWWTQCEIFPLKEAEVIALTLLKKAFAHLNLQTPTVGKPWLRTPTPFPLSHLHLIISRRWNSSDHYTLPDCFPTAWCFKQGFSDSRNISGNSRCPMITLPAAYSTSFNQEVFKCIGLSHSLYCYNRFHHQTDTVSYVWVALSVASPLQQSLISPPTHHCHGVSSQTTILLIIVPQCVRERRKMVLNFHYSVILRAWGARAKNTVSILRCEAQYVLARQECRWNN